MANKIYQNPPSDKEKKSFAKFLAEDEELVLATGYSGIYLRQKFIIYLMIPGALFYLLGAGIIYYMHGNLANENLGYALAIGLLLSILFAYVKTLHTYNSHRYILTTRRVLVKQSFFTVKLSSALYDKITHIEVDQGFIDRFLMHHGTIIIATAGMNKVEMRLENVDSPIEFKNLLERLINKEREHFSRGGASKLAVEGELVEE